MSAKHGEGIRGRALEGTGFRAAISKTSAAILVGCFALVFGGPLRGQDQLLKEYIYLDGRLLVIERQSVPAIAQLPVNNDEKDLKDVFATYWPANDFVQSANGHETDSAHSQGSSTEGGGREDAAMASAR